MQKLTSNLELKRALFPSPRVGLSYRKAPAASVAIEYCVPGNYQRLAVSLAEAIEAEVRLYDHLFSEPDPSVIMADEDWTQHLNPDSLESLARCYLEPSLAGAVPGSRFQFERLGYFCVDLDSSAEAPVFNRTVTLRDQWAKQRKKPG